MMELYTKSFEIRWADLDPNYHVLHSRYYDFGAFCRMSFFVEHGLTPQLMMQHNIGPVLLREECSFKKEIAFGDKLHINLKIDKHSPNFSRWSMSHEVFKGDVLAAKIFIDGAWIDTVKRKLASPPPAITEIFLRINP
jgi:acyl-CoA thioester hydrolase